MAGNAQETEPRKPLADRQRPHQEKQGRDKGTCQESSNQQVEESRERRRREGEGRRKGGTHRLDLGAMLGLQLMAEACKLDGIRKSEEIANRRSMCRW